MSKLNVTLASNDRNGIDDWLKSDDMIRLLKSFAPRLRSTLNQYAVLGDTISRNENWDKSRAEVAIELKALKTNYGNKDITLQRLKNIIENNR